VQADQITRPAYLWVPDHATSSAGREAVDLAKSIGQEPDAEEELALDAILSERADGRWASLEAAIVCGRQNLKTWTLQMSALYDLYVRDVGLVVWTAHRFRTTQEAFRDIHALVDNYDHLRKRVKKVRTANGEEGIELLSGARLDFLARTSGGGRGLSGDTVVLDEALFLTPTMMGSLLPTLSARPDPHVRYGSSAGLRESEVLRNIRDRGRAGGDPSLVYLEWSTEPGGCARPDCDHKPGTAGCQLDDVAMWQAANPALGRRIGVEYLAAERRALPPLEFARERLGWWEEVPQFGDDAIIPETAWASRLEPESELPDGAPVAFAVDTSWDRLTTWIAAAGLRSDGVPHIEVVAHDFGTDWVLPWFRERFDRYKPRAIGLQASGAPVASLLEPLRHEFKSAVIGMGGADLGRACGMFYDSVTSGPLAHRGQQQLDQAVRHAVVRPMSDSWLWDRKVSPVDVAPLVAATAALYLLNTAPEPKKRSGRVAGF
jgi:phage terminase large subunit-like protein